MGMQSRDKRWVRKLARPPHTFVLPGRMDGSSEHLHRLDLLLDPKGRKFHELVHLSDGRPHCKVCGPLDTGWNVVRSCRRSCPATHHHPSSLRLIQPTTVGASLGYLLTFTSPASTVPVAIVPTPRTEKQWSKAKYKGAESLLCGTRALRVSSSTRLATPSVPTSPPLRFDPFDSSE